MNNDLQKFELFNTWMVRVYNLLLLNAAFSICSLPILLAIITLPLNFSNLIYFIGAALALGPAIIGLFAYYLEWRRQGDSPSVLFYFKKYNKFFCSGVGYWLPVCLIVWGTLIELRIIYLSQKGIWLLPIISLLLFSAISLSLIMMYFRVNNEDVSIQKIGIVALFYLLKKWYIMIIIVLLVITFMVMIIMKPILSFCFTSCFFGGGIFYFCSRLTKR